MPAFHHLREFIANYGYWAIAVAVLVEHAGIPVPGETALLLASFLAYSEHRLHLGWIIVAGTCGAALGGALGYAIGYHGGRPLLDRFQSFFHISPGALTRGEALIERYGASTVFFARFLFGMRVVIGPLAGVLHMKTRPFVVFNFLGAAVWAALIAGSGYVFGRHWSELVHVLGRVNLAILAVAGVVIAYLVWRRRREAGT